MSANYVLEVEVAGVSYDLSDDVAYHHIGHDNFGLPPMNQLSQQGPMQHGVTDVGFRLDPRVIPLVLILNGSDDPTYMARRAELLNIFRPSNTLAILRFSYPTDQVREILYRCQGGLTMPSDDKWGYSHKVAVSLFCPDPVWYDPVAEAVTFSLGGGGGSGAIPLAVPMAVGASVLNASEAVAYGGSWRSEPQIRITGPITDCVLTNTTTGDKLDFTGVTIAAADYYDIDCRYGYKTVVDAAGANQIADLTADSDLSTFCLEADPEIASGGVNSFTVTGTGVTTATRLDMTFWNRYLGC